MVNENSARLGCARSDRTDSGVFPTREALRTEEVSRAIHDARNHVLSIFASIDFLENTTAAVADPEISHELQCMKASSRLLALLLSEALSWARYSPQEIIGAERDLPQIVRAAANEFGRYAFLLRHVRIEVDDSARAPVLVEGGIAIRRRIDNLLLDAIHRSADGDVVFLGWDVQGNDVAFRVARQGLDSQRQSDLPEPELIAGICGAPLGDRPELRLAVFRQEASFGGGGIETRAEEQDPTMAVFTTPQCSHAEPDDDGEGAS